MNGSRRDVTPTHREGEKFRKKAICFSDELTDTFARRGFGRLRPLKLTSSVLC